MLTDLQRPEHTALSQRGRPVRWHIVYYLLAAFDVCTVSGGLYLNHEIMGIFRSSVEVNQRWADKLSDLSDIAEAAGAVNAPGNDVFESHNVKVEVARQAAALVLFRQRLENFNAGVGIVSDVAARQQLRLGINRINDSMEKMLSEGDRIFAFFINNNPDAAGGRMATMDRKFATVRAAISAEAQTVRNIQRHHFQEQVGEAAFLGNFEYVFGALIVVMVGCVLVYGHRIAAEFIRHEQESASDTAELENLSVQLRASLSEANAANRATSDFLANMSHEIRTPMNAILGMTGLMLKTELSGEQRHFIETVQKTSDELLGIINNILDIAKLESGSVDIEEIKFDLSETVESAVGLLAMKAREKGIEIAIHVAPSVRGEFIGDPTRIRQVVLNLLSNAIKFTERGVVSIRMAVQDRGIAGVTDGGSVVYFEVSDTGIGMSEKERARLFEKFMQADTSFTRRFGGTGLGLAISKQLVTLMEGTIGAKSHEGVGSTFWFDIPLSRARNTAAPRDLSVTLVNARCLAVDDTELNLEILSRQLASIGLKLDFAQDGFAALAELERAWHQKRPYSIVLLDLMMPGLTGEDVARRIRSTPGIANVMMVLLTSAGREPLNRASSNLFDAILEKPIREKDLLQTLAAHYGARSVSPVNEPTIPEVQVREAALAPSGSVDGGS